MAEESGRTRYHHGFYAAMKVEYDLAGAPVSYEQEKELGEEPVRLDFLIIKKRRDVVLADPIGQFLRAVNLFEYKSPEDGLSIDDFYKAQGYGLIYKGYGRKVNELPIEDMTLTLVRHAYPREMIKALKSSGFEIVETHRGIYRLEGRISIPAQLVVTSRLPDGEYGGLKLLAKGSTKEALVRYAERAVASGNENIKENAGAVIGVCLSANAKLGEELKEGNTMDAAVMKVFKKEFDRRENEVNERVATDMLKDKYPLSAITKISKLSEQTVRMLAKKAGIAIVA